MNQIRTDKRDWDHVGFKDQIGDLLGRTLADMPLYLKGTEPPEAFTPAGREPGAFRYDHSGNLKIDTEKLTLYATLNRQLEIDFEVRDAKTYGSILLAPLRARIGKRKREFKRFNVRGEFIQAGNFQLQQSPVTAKNRRPMVANQILYREFERRLAPEYPGLRIFDYYDREKPFETTLLEDADDSIFVSDALRPDSFASSGPGFLDFRALLEEESRLLTTMRRYREENVKSVLALPVPSASNRSRKPIAFLCCESRERALDLSDCTRLRSAALELSELTADVNTLRLPDKQNILNISEGGVALMVTEPELVRSLPDQKTVNFDLLFRMQAPLRFHGRIAYVARKEARAIVGIDFDGTAVSSTGKDHKARLRTFLRMGLEQAEIIAS